jgi:hypothetical protein
MRINETVRLVCSADPSVQVDAEPLEWRLAEGTPYEADAMVCSIRPLRSSEVLRIGSSDLHIGLEAARLCTTRIDGPGVTASEAHEIAEVLDRIRPAELTALGGKILELSLLPDDPTEGPESGS